MDTNSLDGRSLYNAFISGANAVIKQKNSLNKINVFPVPDGDTGTNLSSTMKSIIETSVFNESAKETLKSISEAALIGARGNSGIIFAQFVNGIYYELGDEESINHKTFGSLLKRAVPYAYNAISNPIEGTMITVMKEWSEAVYSYQAKTNNLFEQLTLSLQAAVEALHDTPNKLKILKENSVVDSGAKGFLHFLEGFVEYIISGKLKEAEYTEEEASAIEISEEHNNTAAELSFRYCTEALLSGEALSADNIKRSISNLGDSIVVAGGNKKVRVHIHTDEPSKVISKLALFGKIIQQKADDMKKQKEIVTNRLSNIALVTDSIADLPQAIIDKYQIHVIPLNILMDGAEYLDKLTITSDMFYKTIDKVKEFPTSSQPSIKSIENLFSFLTSHYSSVIALTVSKELSGTYANIKKVADKFNGEGKLITVINSKLNSGAEGLVVMKAAEAINKGKTHYEVVEMIEDYISKTKIYVSVNTLKYMIRGGRIAPLKGVLAKVLNLKPIVTLDEHGKGAALGKAYSRNGSTKLIIKQIEELKKHHKIKSYSIVHGNAPEKALEYKTAFSKIIGFEPEYITEISSIIAMSAGMGSVAVSLILQ